MKARITTGSYHVFGSGGASVRLMVRGKRIDGVNPIQKDNGFVGFVSTEVNLYPKTPVSYSRGAYPGGGFRFEGSWGDLVAQHPGRLVW
jgi:hypothetical protein